MCFLNFKVKKCYGTEIDKNRESNIGYISFIGSKYCLNTSLNGNTANKKQRLVLIIFTISNKKVSGRYTDIQIILELKYS